MKKLLLLMIAGALAAGVLVRGQGAAMGDAVLQPLTHDVAKELAMKITTSSSGGPSVPAMPATSR